MYTGPMPVFGHMYITIDNVIQAIQNFGPAFFMAKTDIESAFRLFPIHPDDWELLGMSCPFDTLSLFTDATGSLGFGGFFQNSWFQGTWAPSQQLGQPDISILWQELFAINVACHLWGNLMDFKMCSRSY